MDLLARAVLTYLLHSTLLLAAALVACVMLRQRRLGLQEALLRAALVGGFATAALQLGLGLEPLGGTLRLPAAAEHGAAAPAPAPDVAAVTAPSPARAAAAATAAAGSSTAAAPPLGVAAAHVRRLPAASQWKLTLIESPTAVERAWARGTAYAVRHWRSLLLGAWALLALAALGRLLVAAVRLQRLLHGRQRVADAALLDEVSLVAVRLGVAPVPVSCAARIPVPLATGVLRPEVCLPARVLAELGADEQVALCAHELAHVARRDPGWILLARLIEALAPVQPLNRLARRRLQETAECLSDDLAVAASDRPLGLARSLVDVASWSLAERPVLPAAAAALSVRSRVGHRVERLMDPLRRLERPSRFVLPIAAVAVLATAFLSPAVSGSTPEAQGTQAKPAAQAKPATPAKPSAEAAAKPEAAPKAESAGRAAEAERDDTRRLSPEQRRDLEQRLSEITRRIEERAHGHEAEAKAFEERMHALHEQIRPNQAELERLSKEMAAAAAEIAAEVTKNIEEIADGRPARELSAAERQEVRERRREAHRKMADLQKQMHAATAGFRGEHAARAREMAEQAREMAMRARPTHEEMAELRRLSRQLAMDSRFEAREMSREAREAMLEARKALREAREAMREAAREALRELDQVEGPEREKQ